MAIKWKGWTTRLPVKICCVILIPVMAFVLLCGTLDIALMNIGNIDEGFLFTDFNDNNYFYDAFIPQVRSRALNVFGYQSEENIRNMGCLKWEPTDRYYFDDDGVEEQWLSLMSTNPFSEQKWGYVRASDLESPEAKRLVEEAINNQLSSYFYDKEWLEEANGLYYHVTDGEQVLNDLPSDWDMDSFAAYPVYLIEKNGRMQERSRTGDGYYAYGYGYYYSADNVTIRIAFSKEDVDAQNTAWKSEQGRLSANIAIMAASALATLILLIILMAGAGRRYGDSGISVRFTILDKPWLDFGLAALIAYEVAICGFIYYAVEAAWRYDNIRWVILLCAVLAVGFLLPLLWWLLSFIKRCKAGKCWRHTLIYVLIHGFCDKVRGFAKSLWAGVPLTAKAILITLAALTAMLITAAAPPLCILFAAAILVLLLRYSRRLHLVEWGAKAASEGAYNASIAVNGGELGSIAASINRISDGINAAVAQRIKSERLKTELITNVSHDIRTPLTSLITYTDLLKNEGLDSEKAPDYLEVLIQKSARLKTLTDDLFEASKAASGNIEVKLDDLDLVDFVRQVLGEMDERVGASGLDFRFNLPEHAPVIADGKLLWRVMDNLLSNIFKYSLKGSRVYIDIRAENNEYRLDIKNISEHPLNVDPSGLTERFKRGDSSRTDEGSGLGLSISQSFIRAQGGRFALSIDGDLFKATICLPKSKNLFQIADKETPFAQS